MGNDAYPVTFVGEQTQVFPRTLNHLHTAEELPLRDGKPVQAIIMVLVSYTPLGEAVRYFSRKFVQRSLEPLGRYLAHTAVKVRTDPVEIYSDDDVAFFCHIKDCFI